MVLIVVIQLFICIYCEGNEYFLKNFLLLITKAFDPSY